MNMQFTLRQRIEAEIDRLISLLDSADGDCDLEVCCEDEGAQCEDEGDTSDSGIVDHDGYMEQCPHVFQACMQRVE